MKYVDQKGRCYEEETFQDKFLKLLYGTYIGRIKLKILTKPWISRLGGLFLSTGFSKCLIERFVRKNKIDMREYEDRIYTSYNDFFTRRIKPGKRLLPENQDILFSPCDCKASAYRITEDTSFCVKDTVYTVESLLRSRKIADHFRNGYAVILRLTVDDYHRFCYFDNGTKSRNYFIKGAYHTVNPTANDYVSVYKENAREFTMMKTEHFGDAVQMEVGALMVGRIVNHHEEGIMHRGMEKGYFEFGGSTIVLLFRGDKVEIDECLLERTKDGCETKLKQGQRLGMAKKQSLQS